MKFHQLFSFLTVVSTAVVVGVDARISSGNIFFDDESDGSTTSIGAATATTTTTMGANRNRNGGNRNNGNRNNGGGKQKEDLEEEIEILVKYKDNAGKNKMKEESTKGDLDEDYPNFHIATMKIKRKDINRLMRDDHIESFSETFTVNKLGWQDEIQEDDETIQTYLRNGNANSTSSSHQRRQLAESTPYGITMVQANDNFFKTTPRVSTAIKVCVVDTGYDKDHEDLPGGKKPGGGTNAGQVSGFSPSQYSPQVWSTDGDGHGTHCSGTIGAVGSNSIGVTSCNPKPNDFSFYIGKGLNDSGSGSNAGVTAAVNACVAAGAKVISMSLGGGGYSATEENLYKQIYNQGVLIVAAAGNDGNTALSYPASYPSVMSVAAVDSSMNKASYSQYNAQVEIAAPGSSVKSTIPGNSYATWSGTSMATPHVAGVAALVWSYFPTCSNNQIRNVLIKTAKDRGTAGCDVNFGWGIVQAKAAYDLLASQGCAAGGTDFPTKSDGAKGGCSQGESYTPPAVSYLIAPQ